MKTPSPFAAATITTLLGVVVLGIGLALAARFYFGLTSVRTDWTKVELHLSSEAKLRLFQSESPPAIVDPYDYKSALMHERYLIFPLHYLGYAATFVFALAVSSTLLLTIYFYRVAAKDPVDT